MEATVKNGTFEADLSISGIAEELDGHEPEPIACSEQRSGPKKTTTVHKAERLQEWLELTHDARKQFDDNSSPIVSSALLCRLCKEGGKPNVKKANNWGNAQT